MFDYEDGHIIVHDIGLRGQIYKGGRTMSELRKELHNYLDFLPESKLKALKPILILLADDTIVVETNLTDDEKEIIRQGRKEYEKGGYVSLDSIE